jgi:uncharacterized protein (TIGR00251 family)
MDKQKNRLHSGKTGAAITVKVMPRSSKNQIIGIMEDGTVKIRLTAPPVEGQANNLLIRFLSDILNVPATNIEIVAGQTGRNKLVTIIGLDAPTVQKRILSVLQ